MKIEIPFFKWKVGLKIGRKKPEPWHCFFQDKDGNIVDRVPVRDDDEVMT